MDNQELINKYELVIILDAKMVSEDKDAIISKIKEDIAKEGGVVHNSQVWLEKHKFAFEIKKLTEGTYYLINFDALGGVVAPLQAKFKLNEKILRYKITRNESVSATEAKK